MRYNIDPKEFLELCRAGMSFSLSTNYDLYWNRLVGPQKGYVYDDGRWKLIARIRENKKRVYGDKVGGAWAKEQMRHLRLWEWRSAVEEEIRRGQNLRERLMDVNARLSESCERLRARVVDKQRAETVKNKSVETGPIIDLTSSPAPGSSTERARRAKPQTGGAALACHPQHSRRVEKSSKASRRLGRPAPYPKPFNRASHRAQQPQQPQHPSHAPGSGTFSSQPYTANTAQRDIVAPPARRPDRSEGRHLSPDSVELSHETNSSPGTDIESVLDFFRNA